jgi:hypothetical protein
LKAVAFGCEFGIGVGQPELKVIEIPTREDMEGFVDQNVWKRGEDAFQHKQRDSTSYIATLGRIIEFTSSSSSRWHWHRKYRERLIEDISNKTR